MGYPTYFQYLKFCCAILLFLLCLSGAFNLYTNYKYGRTCLATSMQGSSSSSSISTNCQSSWVTLLSIGNKANDKNLLLLQDVLNLISIFMMIVVFQFFRRYLRIQDQECDLLDKSACDYTLLIKNIPKEFDALNNDYDEDLKFFVENKLMPHTISVVKVNLCYSMDKLDNLSKKKKQIVAKKKREILRQHRLCYSDSHLIIADFDVQIAAVQDEIDDLLNHFLDGRDKFFMRNYFAQWAFVSVKTEQGNALSLCFSFS